jgi:Uma2 family endonuclease
LITAAAGRPAPGLRPRRTTASTPTATECTPEQLLALPDGDRYELVEGRLVDRHGAGAGRQPDAAMGWLSDLVATRLATRLTVFADQGRLGYVVISNSGGFQYGGRKVRKPDVSFTARSRFPSGATPTGNAPCAPDLAALVLSPNDLAEEVELKVEEYLRSGVRLVWVISPAVRTIRVLRADGAAAVVRADGKLDGEDVLPGFRCRLADLFPAAGGEAAESPPDGNGNT